MPIFEFVCTDCGTSFEELVFSINKIDAITCPVCQSQSITKRISSFASKLSGSGEYSVNSASSPSCNSGSV